MDWFESNVSSQVVNRLRKEYVHDTLLNYGVHYDNTWIYDKIHHEINQFCSSHTLQQVYIDVFDQVRKNNELYLHFTDVNEQILVHLLRKRYHPSIYDYTWIWFYLLILVFLGKYD